MKKYQKRELPGFIIILLLLVSAIGCLEVPVLKVNVKVIASPEGKPEINNITVEQTSIGVLARPGEPPARLPGIYCQALKREGNYFSPASLWSNVQYNGTGSYEMIVDFEKPPSKGEKIRLWIAVYDEQGGDPIVSGIMDYEWK